MKTSNYLLHESKILNQEITTLFQATVDIESNIAEVANNGEYDLLLVGLGLGWLGGVSFAFERLLISQIRNQILIIL